MNAENSKLRVALAVFDPPASAVKAIQPLLREGIPAGRIGLVLRQSAAHALGDTLSEIMPGDAALEALIDTLSRFATAPDGEPLLASPRLLRPWRSGWRFAALWGDGPSDGAETKLAPDPERHVITGAVIVAVESLSAREHWRCTRILLDQSSSSVLALECSLPALATCNHSP